MRDDRFLGQNLFDGPSIARRSRRLSRIHLLGEDKLLGQLAIMINPVAEASKKNATSPRFSDVDPRYSQREIHPAR